MTLYTDNYGLLYIIATPIGNLEDITLRALRILKEVDLVAAEDTRHTRKLLNAYKIKTSLISLHEHNEKERSSLIIAKIKSGINVAYVSDAGTPCISDPGHHLVSLARQENIRVIPLPGPSAVITALSACGFPADSFIFFGFLPAKENKRRKFFEEIKNEEKTIVFYESPMRFLSSLKDMSDVLGDREVVIARELTKVFEEIKRGNISEFLQSDPVAKTKGEFTIILKAEEKKQKPIADEEIKEKLFVLRKTKKISMRDAIAEVVKETGLSKKKIYDLAVQIHS